MATTMYRQSAVASGGDKKPKSTEVPKGFPDVLTMLVKKIITHRPLNVRKFCADVLENELDRRTLREISTESECFIISNLSYSMHK